MPIKNFLRSLPFTACFAIYSVSCVGLRGGNETLNNGPRAPLDAPATRVTGALLSPASSEVNLPACQISDLGTDRCTVHPLCSGVLIQDDRLMPAPVFLTAAHCLDQLMDESMIYLPAQKALLKPKRKVWHLSWESETDSVDLGYIELEPDDAQGLEFARVAEKLPTLEYSEKAKEFLTSPIK